VICFDTMVLIWGVQERASAGQEDRVERTARYIRHLTKKNEKVMVPAPVLAEFLAGFPAERRAEIAQAVERLFFVSAFDAKCAILAAGFSDRGRSSGEPPRMGERQWVKADASILACAVAHGASTIVTGEARRFEKLLAGTALQAIDVPSVEEQAKLEFEALDIDPQLPPS